MGLLLDEEDDGIDDHRDDDDIDDDIIIIIDEAFLGCSLSSWRRENQPMVGALGRRTKCALARE